MGLNSTDSDKVAQASRDLADKLKLERGMNIVLRKFFSNMARDLTLVYAETGNPINADDYATDLFSIINNQYKRTSKAFSNQISKFLLRNKRSTGEKIITDLTSIASVRGVSLNALIKTLDSQVALEISRFIGGSSIRDTVRITATNQKDIDKSVLSSRAALQENLGRTPTRREVAKGAGKDFKRRSFSRVGTIAATTTQVAAEGTKQIERDNLKSITNSTEGRESRVIPLKDKDVWVTQGDSLVRDGDGSRWNHLAADFQEKADGRYVVSGEFLRYPGDQSLGASMGNTINCRCSSVTVIE